MSGRHRAGVSAKGPGAAMKILGVLVVLAAVATLTVRWLTTVDLDCGEQVTLTVDVVPAIAPALTEFVTDRLPELDGEAQCLKPQIRAAAAQDTFEALTPAGESHEPDTSVGPLQAGRPDVWIPDSTVWLQRAAQAGAGLPPRGSSIATSPVVFATAEPIAAQAGWPSKPALWSAVLSGPGEPGIVEPSADAGSLFALMGIDTLGWPTDRKTRTVTTMSQATVPRTDDPFHLLPGGGGAPTITLFPAPEQQVVRHNTDARQGSQGSTVAAYPDRPTPWLDYPVAVRTDLDDARRAAGEAFRKVLRSPEAARVLAAHGFRDIRGSLTGAAAEDPRVRVDAGPLVPPPAAEQADVALRQWAMLSRLARVLVVLDVSESMDSPVGKTGKTRMQVTLAAASQGLSLFRPGTQVSLWEFSTELDGKRDYREITPYKPIIKHLAEGLPEKLDKLVTSPKGATGLYDTVLAGYRQTMRLWDPAHLNLLVIFTGGKNEDKNGISRSRLLAELGTLTDPARPAPVIFVGLGTDIDPRELRDISRATGGQTFLAPKVTDIQRIFFTALGKLACPGGRC